MPRLPTKTRVPPSEPDQVVVVTGASAGLGRAVARRFAEKGARLGLISRGAEGLQSTLEEVTSCGATAVAVPADVADWGQVSGAAQRIEDELGPITAWVNNAMISVFAPFKEAAMEDFRRVTEVNYLGYVHGTRAALDHMLPRDQGVIVQVGSALALRSIPLQSAYCGSKHAIVGFTQALRTELLHDGSGIKVTLVQMPAMNTPQFEWVRSTLPRRPRPVAPIYQPEVAARAVCFATAHPRRSYYVGASTALTVAANKMVPGLLDHYLARTGYRAQQSEEPDEPDRPDNLYQALSGDLGAHGRFDHESHRRSLQLWLTTHRGRLAAAFGGAGVLLFGSASRKRTH